MLPAFTCVCVSYPCAFYIIVIRINFIKLRCGIRQSSSDIYVNMVVIVVHCNIEKSSSSVLQDKQ